MTTYAPFHSDGTYCEVAARYREGQRSDGDCARSHRWHPATADHYGDAVCNCSNPYCQV